jgi:hypothetical protein
VLFTAKGLAKSISRMPRSSHVRATLIINLVDHAGFPPI